LRITNPVAGLLWPLERKLPLLIAALLCAIVGAFGYFAHEELESAFETAASARLVAAAHRMSALLVESAAAVRSEGSTFARDPAIVAMLMAEPRSAPPDGDVFRVVMPNAVRETSRALWTKDCRLVAAHGSLARSPALTTCPGARPAAVPYRYGLQPLASWGDSIMYVLILPVVRATDTLGFYVQARVVGEGSSARVVTGLLGEDSKMMLGNAAGEGVWTNLAGRVTGPSTRLQRDVAVHYVPAMGVQQLGVMLDVPATPWLTWAEMPYDSAMEGLYQPLLNMAAFGLLCIALGVFGAWLLSRHVTAPIAELTRAEEDFAAGNYGRRVKTGRRDELGGLLTAFNGKAERVEASNAEINTAFTLMKEAHRDRQSAQSLLDEVLSQAPVGIAVFDEAMRFIRVNDAFSALTGHPVAAHIGRAVGTMMPPMSPTTESQLAHMLSSGSATTNQLSSSTGVGAKRYWTGSYFPVRGPAGDVTRACAILVDITAHRELEAQFLHAQKMDAVGRLAGGVAHDFNNLLTIIISYSEMALQSLPPEEELYGDMKEIHLAAERAARLTRQLLAFSRKQVLTPQVLNLNHLAAEMESMLRRLIGDDVTLVFESGVEQGNVRADAGQIEQVIMNLAVNARDAMPDGGRLVMRTADAIMATDQVMDSVTIRAGEYVTLSVSDTGVGMSDETRAHLFEPFYTTKGSGLGTGLGLSTVYGIVKQSGGEIAIETELGRGSTFVVYLPRISSDDA
jgi:PAS domain S-box-containing protein